MAIVLRYKCDIFMTENFANLDFFLGGGLVLLENFGYCKEIYIKFLRKFGFILQNTLALAFYLQV